MERKARLPRGRIIGERTDTPALTEAEHYMRCPQCGGWFDCRDLGQVFDHAGALPHPVEDQAQ